MKIQCDVCHKEVASFFCPSDEASLCHACDRTIHHPNKLSEKHKRFSLHHSISTKDSPLCDICHIGADASDPTSFSSNDTAIEERTTSSSKINRPSSFSNENISSSRTVGDNMACDKVSVSTSSISEYLIQTIPGYCMEDLLDASFASNSLSKDYEHQSAFQNQDVQVSMRSFPLQTWVPQSQGGSPQRSFTSNLYPQIDSLVGVMEMPKAKAGEGYSNWIYNYDYAAYKLPSICPPLIKKMQTLSLINCM
ncbi:B-box zinc finger protein 21 [Glycine soja]|uniref:B-box zinc finger protein 21 n=2 Tax=Glycine soja TaxID=3848 RepID=A0A445HKC7_GLYSO|nr:B-box zinc finger protein 21 [Glycine soja]